jgi:hypothetical protein
MKMLKKIKEFLSRKRIVNQDIVFTPIKPTMTQENPIVTRVKEAFKQQKHEMQLRALVPHSCDDPLNCERNPCWKFEPDKIVSDPYAVEQTPQRKKAQGRVRKLYTKMKRNE